MKKILLMGIIAVTLLSMTGCNEMQLNLNTSGIYEDEAFKTDVMDWIDKGFYSDAFEKVDAALKSGRFDSIEMNEIATKFIEAGVVEEGIIILQTLFYLNPEMDTFSNNLSWGYYAIADYKLANHYANLALKIEPNDAIEYVNKGNAVKSLDDMDEAMIHYDMALEINPNESTAVWGKALTSFDQANYEDALFYFEKYNALSPDDEAATRYYIGKSYEYLEDYETAIQVYTRHYESDPTDTTPLYAIGWIYISEYENYEEALKHFEKIVQYDNEDAWGYLDIAVSLTGLGRTTEACENIKKAIEIDADMMYELSYYEAFETLKDLPEYKEIFK